MQCNAMQRTAVLSKATQSQAIQSNKANRIKVNAWDAKQSKAGKDSRLLAFPAMFSQKARESKEKQRKARQKQRESNAKHRKQSQAMQSQRNPKRSKAMQIKPKSFDSSPQPAYPPSHHLNPPSFHLDNPYPTSSLIAWGEQKPAGSGPGRGALKSALTP